MHGNLDLLSHTVYAAVYIYCSDMSGFFLFSNWFLGPSVHYFVLQYSGHLVDCNILLLLSNSNYTVWFVMNKPYAHSN